MDEVILRAVERAVETMRTNLGDKLTIDDLARSAMFSKFHFSRLFQRVTGVSPGRFLSAIRIEEAKRLLLSTSITVADIGHRVGYNSVGTFSSRFRNSVGVSPITYRQLGGVAPGVPAERRTGPGTIQGLARASSGDRLDTIFVGLFPGPIPEGPPISYTTLRGPGPYLLSNVPVGTWHLMAHAREPGEPGEDGPYVGFHGPITTRSDAPARLADLRLHRMRALDPPLLLALPDLDPETDTETRLDIAG